MKFQIKNSIWIISLLLLMSCASTQQLGPLGYSHQKETLFGAGGQAPELTQEYNFNYEYVWNATIQTIQEAGHPIQTISKETGTLTTDWFERAGGPFFLGTPTNYFADRFSIRLIKLGDSKVKVGITRNVQEIKGIKKTPKTSDGEIEKWILEQIAFKLSSTSKQ